MAKQTTKPTHFLAMPAVYTTEKVSDIAYPISAGVRDSAKQHVIHHYNAMAQCLSILAMDEADFKARMADKDKRYQLCQMAKMLDQDREAEVVRTAVRDTAYVRVAEALEAQGLNASAELSGKTDMSVIPQLSTLEKEQTSRLQRRG